MKFPILTASLLAVALFATPALAQDGPVLEQSQQDELAALLADTRSASALTDEELGQRLKSLRGFRKNEDLPRDVKKQLRDMERDIRTEMASRQQGGEQQQAQIENPEAQVAPEQPATEALEDNPEPEKKKRRRDKKAAEEAVIEQPPVEQPVVEQPVVEQPVVEQPVVEQPVVEQPPVEQSIVEPPPVQQPVVEQPIVEAPPVVEVPLEQAAPTPKLDAPAAAIEKKQVQVLDGNQADPGVEAKAKAYLGDGVDVSAMSDDDLRARLDAARDLMEDNQLSRDTERAVRRKLKAERNVLRNRVAVAEAKQEMKKAEAEQPQASGKGGKTDQQAPQIVINIEQPPPAKVVLRDQRAADDLEDIELRRRIDVLRETSMREEFEPEERMKWRKTVERDRRVLRDRMLTDRSRRENELQLEYKKGAIDIELGIEFEPSRPPRDHAFAAEIDDEELEEVLVAPPRRKLKRRYSIEEVEQSEDLREAVTHIEIDTVRFGFGEAFVREEEIENLDRIAEVMERILTAHPREVFMIEGHTDAVGSNAANLVLSRSRAVAIKKALMTYYIIPSANLRTVGYGERFLKIPTSEPEEENRRVSIARATALLGEVEQSELDGE